MKLTEFKQNEPQLRWSGSEFLVNSTQEPPFLGAAVGSGGSATQGDSSLGHIGGRMLFSGTLGDSGYKYQTVSNMTGQIGECGYVVFKTGTNLSDVTYRFGFHNSTTSSDATNGAGYMEVVAGAVSFKTALASVRTTFATGVTLATSTYYRITFERIASGTMKFTLYSDAWAVLSTTTIATNVPVAVGNTYLFGAVATKSSGGAIEIMTLDYMGLGMQKPIGLINF